MKRFSRFMPQTKLNKVRGKAAAYFEPVMNAVEYGNRDWRPSTLLKLIFVTHCTAQFQKSANEQAAVPRITKRRINTAQVRKVTLTTASSPDFTLLISSVMQWLTNWLTQPYI